MTYLLIERTAIDEIIQERLFQNVGFAPAKALLDQIRGKGEGTHLLRFYSHKGLIVTGAKSRPSKDFILFDLDTARILAEHNDSELLTIIQKALRFAVKYWDSLIMSSSERIIKASTKAVIFPFPFAANKVNYRLTIEREPNAKRLARRDDGRFLLVYKNGTSTDDGPDDTVSITNFKRGYEEYQEIYRKINTEILTSKSVEGNNFMGVVNLDGDIPKKHVAQGLDNWMLYLTEDQRRFVTSGWDSPQRLEGAAGTGKTLCMVLKALRSLKNARLVDKAHRCVFITPSDELSNSVHFLFQTNGGADYIEEAAFSEKEQFVRVVTLQRLCGDYLNYEVSENEFLDRDSVESKNTQLLYLDDIIQRVKGRELSLVRGFLSSNLSEFLIEEDIWTVAQMLRHEISVVIKGRANADLDAYKRIPSLAYGLPIVTGDDKEFIFKLFSEYQHNLTSMISSFPLSDNSTLQFGGGAGNVMASIPFSSTRCISLI